MFQINQLVCSVTLQIAVDSAWVYLCCLSVNVPVWQISQKDKGFQKTDTDLAALNRSPLNSKAELLLTQMSLRTIHRVFLSGNLKKKKTSEGPTKALIVSL